MCFSSSKAQSNQTICIVFYFFSERKFKLNHLAVCCLWFSQRVKLPGTPWNQQLHCSPPTLTMETHTDSQSYYLYNDNDNKSLDWNIVDIPDCPSAHLQGTNVFLTILYSVIFVVGIMGNVLVIAVVGNKGGRLVDTFVVNLALADLVFVVTLPVWAVSASQNNRWEFGSAGNLLCKLSSYIIAVNRFSNIFFLTCMSVDRYLAVVKLMDSRLLRRSRYVRTTCAAVWSSSLVLGIPRLVYRRVVLLGNDPACTEDAGSYFFLSLSLLMVLLTFILPVLIMAFCYSTIIVHLNKHCVGAANPRSRARRRHSVKIVLSIITAFVVSWLPFNVFKVITTSSQLSGADGDCSSPWQQNGLLFSCCLAFLNSCMNPVIYFCLDHHFRRRAEVLVRACRGRPPPPQSTNTSATGTKAGTSENMLGTADDGASHV